jgi:hypothetical protein
MSAMRAPHVMEFLVPDKHFLAALKPGQRITAGVRKRGADYILEPVPHGGNSAGTSRKLTK